MKKPVSYYNEGMWKGAPSTNFSKAIELRKNMTEPETILWERLKNNKINGVKFRRQHPVHLFIVDFYCHQYGLVIEIDGEYHNTEEQKLKDEERTKLLEFQNLKVLRFTNEEVMKTIENVIEKIKTEMTTKK